MTKMMIVGDQAFKFNIWDTAGQERVSSFTLESAEYLLFSQEFILEIRLQYNCILFIHLMQFKSLAPLYYRDAAAAILVYDITSDVSFTGFIIKTLKNVRLSFMHMKVAVMLVLLRHVEV